MKYMKKLLALALAVMLVMSLATTASADTTATYTITAPSDSTRTYNVYQIFTGDYDSVSGKLSNVMWGKNGTGTASTAVDEDVLTELTSISAGTADAAKLETIKKYVNINADNKFGVVTASNPLTVPAGYYLIEDNGPVNNGESYSLYVVEVADDITISPKVGKVTSDKEVKDTNDTEGTTTNWQESADYDVGDDVPFKLTAKLPEDYDRYTKGYKLTFHDTLSTGLSFNNDVKVYIDGTLITSGYEVVTSTTDGCTFEVKFANLKTTAAKASSVITVEYTAKLNAKASTGSTANTNKSNVTYTNNPNDDQAGENGSTPEDTVVVFTYNVVVNKVDKNGEELTGAGFTLYKWNANATADANNEKWVAVGEEITGVTTFTFAKLDEGKYKLVETTVPAGYNKAADIIFTVESTITDETLTNLAVKDVTGAEVTDFTITVEYGNIATNVVNNAGATLPETGGIGTTIFYALGSILVLAAVVLLVTKKRMASAK